jgi:hypothetical protein
MVHRPTDTCPLCARHAFVWPAGTIARTLVARPQERSTTFAKRRTSPRENCADSLGRESPTDRECSPTVTPSKARAIRTGTARPVPAPPHAHRAAAGTAADGRQPTRNRKEKQVTSMSGSTQESVIIDIWTVPSGRQEEMINELLAAFEQFRLMDGFIAGGVLTNGDDTQVASCVRVRSAADREGAAERGEVRERMRALATIGSSHADSYERMWVIAPPRHGDPPQTFRGVC